MLSHPLVQMLAQYRAEEIHEQARRAVLAKAVRRARRAQRQQAAPSRRSRQAHGTQTAVALSILRPSVRRTSRTAR